MLSSCDITYATNTLNSSVQLSELDTGYWTFSQAHSRQFGLAVTSPLRLCAQPPPVHTVQPKVHAQRRALL